MLGSLRPADKTTRFIRIVMIAHAACEMENGRAAAGILVLRPIIELPGRQPLVAFGLGKRSALCAGKSAHGLDPPDAVSYDDREAERGGERLGTARRGVRVAWHATYHLPSFETAVLLTHTYTWTHPCP